jgi:2-dehydropantoate 2-reductase
MDQVIDAANKCGYSLEHAAAKQQMERTETMGAYKPSTLLDFEARQPLEIEAIWGEPFRRAAAAGAATPRLELLYSLLRAFDQTRRRAGNI